MQEKGDKGYVKNKDERQNNDQGKWPNNFQNTKSLFCYFPVWGYKNLASRQQQFQGTTRTW